LLPAHLGNTGSSTAQDRLSCRKLEDKEKIVTSISAA
jgi:hypothetical protein